MRARLVPIFALIMALMITRSEAGEPEREPLPQPAPGWSIELAANLAVPEWGGVEVPFRAEENAFFDGKSVHFIDGRETELRLIK